MDLRVGRYLSDLLELSGNQAIIIREARDAGEPNVAQYYERFLRECFDFLDEHKTGQIHIDELVKPSGSHVTEMLAAVRHLSAIQKTNPKSECAFDLLSLLLMVSSSQSGPVLQDEARASDSRRFSYQWETLRWRMVMSCSSIVRV